MSFGMIVVWSTLFFKLLMDETLFFSLLHG